MIRNILFLFSLTALIACGRGDQQDNDTDDTTATAQKSALDGLSREAIDSLAARRFAPTFESPEELVNAFLLAALEKDADALQSLLVNEQEFSEWLWPEFPASDPALNIPLDFAWGNLAKKSNKGLRRVMRTLGGKPFTLRGIRHVEDDDVYPTFLVRQGTRVDITDGTGETGTITLLGSIVDLNGTFKFMSYRE
jgi:hypothetical protein